jgi:gamma-glutamyltranspeptidase/glutathione hydrolase
LGAALMVSVLSACGAERQPGVLGYVEGFAGVVAADEPRAAVVGRDVLSSGGTAADAAVAMGFTLTVTLPTSAGLGGGGVCLIQDRDDDGDTRVEVLDFLPREAAGLPGPGGAVAVPAMPRGLYALHARSGALRWESLVSPAESLARFGFPASRALAAEVRALGVTAPIHGVVAPVEGQRLENLSLARGLGLARVSPGEYHAGPVARELIAAADAGGYGIDTQTLRDWRPVWRPARLTDYRSHKDAFSPVPDSAADFAHRWAGADGAGDPSALPPPLPDLADSVAHGMSGGMGDRGATGFLVADSFGGAVACALTLNRPMGTGRPLPGFGFALAPLPTPQSPAIAIMLRLNTHSDVTLGGVAAAGGGAVDLALETGVPALKDGRSPAESVSRASAGGLGKALVTLMSCPDGIPRSPETCRVAVDPRGAGLSMLVGEP